MQITSLSILVLVTILTMSISFSSLQEPAYSQKETNSSLTITNIQNTSLTLGKPIYVEKFKVPLSSGDGTGYSNINNTSDFGTSIYSFKGNGTLEGMKISASGSGIMVPRDDGTSSITGRAIFISSNGSASYSFEDIATTTDNITQRLGSAFFDANATGTLEFLKSSVGVYQSFVDNRDGQGIFAMWNLKGFTEK
ncbi:hypothetical protein [Candidatus Nitrosocosmicus franklandus]|uniref:Uncharacterized protein n=1 Tax=Candidatus Nitrosocosmicus franklandianus TaxID=1798806 RepID=A0A484ICT5_9ARCH|nr:hypothetical protein [Candidatus Nitrosocosmicus franklandus]VFJ14920.1 conserved exported protein of unknown function [Candidatus Nitrosocosmicus franklandus]